MEKIEEMISDEDYYLDYLNSIETKIQGVDELGRDLFSSGDEEDIPANLEDVSLQLLQHDFHEVIMSMKDEELGAIVSPTTNTVVQHQEITQSAPEEFLGTRSSRKQNLKPREDIADKKPKTVRQRQPRPQKVQVMAKDQPLHTRDPENAETEEDRRRILKAQKAFAYREGRQKKIDDLTQRNALLEAEKAELNEDSARKDEWILELKAEKAELKEDSARKDERIRELEAQLNQKNGVVANKRKR